MAPAQPARVEKDKRLRTILAFASDLEVRLPTAAASTTPDVLVADIEHHIFILPVKFGLAAGARLEEADRIGTIIWNLCTRLRRDAETDGSKDAFTILLLARVFSFLLLDGAHNGGGNSAPGNLARLMKIGIKAGRSCIEMQDFDLARRVFERVANYIQPEAKPASPDKESCEKLIPEYYVLRTALSWRLNQLDLADHMFKLSIASLQTFDPHTAESLADILYEIGKDLLHKQDFALSVKWLERAFEVLNGQELERLSIDATELRTSIIQSLVKALLALKDQSATEKAQSHIQHLEDVLGNRLIVLLLKLEILDAPSTEVFDSGQYSDILHRMMRSITITDVNFKLLMFHTRKLNDKSPSLASKALDQFLSLRILHCERDDFIEKVFITRLWITISQRESPDALNSLEELFSLVTANSVKPLSAAATHGAHTLLWKRIESNYTQGQYDLAEKWCHLATHKLFANSGEHNISRISRKLLLCAIAKRDIDNAREIFSAMSETGKNEPMTRFLMYKIAVRCEESELAAESLDVISSGTAKDLTLLYACCLDAQKAGNKIQTLAALQLVLEKYGYSTPSAIQMPTLIRTTIQLVISLLGDPVPTVPDNLVNVEKLCKLFEGAVTSIHKSTVPDSVWNLGEIDWFSKNSYNLVIKNISTWEPRHSLRLLACCIDFVGYYPEDISDQVSDDICLRKMFCEFSAATALIALARGQGNVETQLQDYLNVRKHVTSFNTLLQEKMGKVGEDAQGDLIRKLSVLIAFDMEAACHLKAWDDLSEIVLRAEMCKSQRVYELMADCILCSQVPTQVLVNTLKKIINEAWGLDTMDVSKLAKYMRCLFQIAMLDNLKVAEELIDLVHGQAEEAMETDQPYPSEELEWIVTRSFNYAIDLYCASDEDGCRNWAGKALNVAHYCADDGALERMLQGKWATLKLDS